MRLRSESPIHYKGNEERQKSVTLNYLAFHTIFIAEGAEKRYVVHDISPYPMGSNRAEPERMEFDDCLSDMR